MVVDDRHAGLQLDKFSAGPNQQQQQGQAIDRVVECRGDPMLLRALLQRRESALDRLGARRYRGQCEGPLTLHLSRSGSLENAGIALHPIYGFAWLPGTGIKGMVRAWAETVWRPDQSEPANADETIRRVFGTTRTGEGDGERAGGVVFHDAWPMRWPALERDIVNNHHTKYYGGKGAPNDAESPTLVSFLAMSSGTEFEFALSPRGAGDDAPLDLAEEWLRSALAYAGAGAKTAAGYGRIVPMRGSRPPAPSGIVSSEHTLELLAPAFLAGAAQNKADCDLRSPTLRGLLRWWWRTMHAGRLRPDHLLELETAVWGGASTAGDGAGIGSPVSLTLVPHSRNPPAALDYKSEASNHGLADQPSNRKFIQGIHYLGYGMQEKKNSRWFRHPGARWTLRLSVRDGFWRSERKPSIAARELLGQAEAALWLLTRFGGAGSRSRKGFGSFVDVEVNGIRSVRDCLNRAKEFRRSRGLPSRGSSDSASLEETGRPLEVSTPWKDPWFAVDQVGAVYQEFSKELELRDRTALGTPRRGAPRDAPKRHASPAHWSLSRTADGQLVVRLIAFPAVTLPDRKTSQRVLRDLVRQAKTALEKRGDRFRSKGQQAGVPRTRTQKAKVQDLVSGSRVRAVLRKKRTKKGGWLARTADDRKSLPVVNSRDVPAAAAPEQEYEFIFGGNGLYWPTPEAQKRFRPKPQGPKGRRPQRGRPGHGSRGGPRGRGRGRGKW